MDPSSPENGASTKFLSQFAYQQDRAHGISTSDSLNGIRTLPRLSDLRRRRDASLGTRRHPRKSHWAGLTHQGYPGQGSKSQPWNLQPTQFLFAVRKRKSNSPDAQSRSEPAGRTGSTCHSCKVPRPTPDSHQHPCTTHHRSPF